MVVDAVDEFSEANGTRGELVSELQKLCNTSVYVASRDMGDFSVAFRVMRSWKFTPRETCLCEPDSK